MFAQVQKHLSKLFDNVAKMRFEVDGEGTCSRTGVGMFSREDEYVAFSRSCQCTGQVHAHLQQGRGSHRTVMISFQMFSN